MALYRSPLTVTLWSSSFLKKYGPMIPAAHKAHQTGLIATLGDSLWFINVNEQNKRKKCSSLRSLLDEDETDHAREELHGIMDINYDRESKFEKRDKHETFELKGKFSNAI
ncbi:hypothetical protein TNCV_4903921 [Trichonephila clavipes]|nr:hypothetical protein TNCV_4903921 [Trichonephila clavipes]